MLITGETGTGKEVLARLIHEWSGCKGSFVAVNCAAFLDNLIESQLFGHVKGAFTDAYKDHTGSVREAEGGTLFLDEIGELSERVQAKLLRLVELGEILPVGTSLAERVNVRIVAATNKLFRSAVAEGEFRKDLYYRLNTFETWLPPLRERVKDIIALAYHFIAEVKRRHQKQVVFTDASVKAMQQMPLLGNARELRAIIERIVLTAAEGQVITGQDVANFNPQPATSLSLPEAFKGCDLNEEILRYEKRVIALALKQGEGSITNAARLLGINYQSLAYLLKTRHKDLEGARTPVTSRRRSIIKRPRERRSYD